MDIPILSDIWSAVKDQLNWVIFLIVLFVGYGIRMIPYGKKWRLTARILYSTIIVSGAYAIAMKISIGVWIASYFITIGAHSLIIKLIEGWFVKRFPSLGEIGRHVGPRPPKPPRK